jgi:alpha-D-ribose 1-methylphosphonate 5-triphosphate synthase subunit PhnG
MDLYCVDFKAMGAILHENRRRTMRLDAGADISGFGWPSGRRWPLAQLALHDHAFLATQDRFDPVLVAAVVLGQVQKDLKTATRRHAHALQRDRHGFTDLELVIHRLQNLFDERRRGGSGTVS